MDELEDAVLAYSVIEQHKQEFSKMWYGRFNFEELNERECLTWFRFKKAYLKQLVTLLNIPAEVRCTGRHSVMGK